MSIDESSIPGPYKIVGATSFGVFLSALDASIVNVSLPTIAAWYSVSIGEIQWIVLAYLLIMTSAMPLMGKFGDRFGKRRIFQLGMIIFTLGSLFCAFSPTLLALILSRVFQAAGASMMSANGLALVTYFTTPENRGRAIGLNSVTLAAALGLGPVLGGILSDTFGWMSIFLVNLPIGIIGYIVVIMIVPRTEQVREVKFDTVGAALFFLFLFSFVYYVSVVDEIDILVSIILLGLTIAFFISFILRERSFISPIIPTGVLADRRISISVFSAFFAYMSIVPITFLLPFFMQTSLGYTATITGLFLTAHPITISVMGPVAGFVSERVVARVQTVIGLLLALVGLYIIGLVVGNLSLMFLGIIVMGTGFSIFSVANGNFIMTSAPREYMGVISALTNISRTTGFSIATALVTSVFGFFLVFVDPTYYPEGPINVALQSTAFQMAVWSFLILIGTAAVLSWFRGLSPSEEKRRALECDLVNAILSFAHWLNWPAPALKFSGSRGIQLYWTISKAVEEEHVPFFMENDADYAFIRFGRFDEEIEEDPTLYLLPE